MDMLPILTIYNKMFSLNSGMNNLDQLSFLDKIQWKLAKQIKENNLKNIFHNSTVTVNLLDMFENAYRKNVLDI